MHSLDPKDYFRKTNLLESIPLEVQYAEARAEFALVLAYANIDALMSQRGSSSTSLPREFKRLVFYEVSRPRRENVSMKSIKAEVLNYSSPDIQKQALQKLELQTKLDRFSIRIGFGTFGDYCFTFRSLAEEQRLGKGFQVSTSTWKYTDLATGQVFDFDQPFG